MYMCMLGIFSMIIPYFDPAVLVVQSGVDGAAHDPVHAHAYVHAHALCNMRIIRMNASVSCHVCMHV